MGLSVSLGLGRFYSEDERAAREDGLRAVVETGRVDLVRDIVVSQSLTEVVEAFRTGETITVRTLDEAEAEPILRDLNALYKEYGSPSASFSWEQTENLAFDVQDLAIVFNADADPMEKLDVELSERARMISIARSKQFNWKAKTPRMSKFARAMHDFAENHFSIVHSA